MSADAVFLPARATVREAIVDAIGIPHEPSCRLYTDGHRVAWLPRPIPGWFRLAAAEVRDAYEQTDATAGCCDMDEAAA
jgi:hypothetical protein